MDALRNFEQSAAAMPPALISNRDAIPRHKPSISRDALHTSPRMYAFDPSRRPSLQVTGAPPVTFRPPMHLSKQATSPQRPGDRLDVSPASGRILPRQVTHAGPGHHHAPQQHLQAPSSPTMNLGRRHTAADIHSHGWQGTMRHGDSSPPPVPGQIPGQNQLSPFRKSSVSRGDQQIRDTLAQYELKQPGPPSHIPRHATPPVSEGQGNGGHEAGWQVPGTRVAFGKVDYSGSGSRRTSMANLLNPAEGTEDRDGEDRKRKRLA